MEQGGSKEERQRKRKRKKERKRKRERKIFLVSSSRTQLQRPMT
jgi:hypothetical protein